MTLEELKNTYVQLHYKSDEKHPGTIGSMMPTGLMKSGKYISLFKLAEVLTKKT